MTETRTNASGEKVQYDEKVGRWVPVESAEKKDEGSKDEDDKTPTGKPNNEVGASPTTRSNPDKQ